MIVQNSVVQRDQWLSFVVCELEKTICPLPCLKIKLNSIKNVHVPRASERNYYWWGNFVKNVPPLKRIVPELQYCWKCSLLHNVFERQINQNRTKLKALHSLQHCNRIRLHC